MTLGAISGFLIVIRYVRINCEITTITYGDDQYAILINGPSSQEHILIYLIRCTVCLCIISDMYTEIVQLNNILSIYAKFYIGYENISRSGSCIFAAVRGLLHACVFIPACVSLSLYLQCLMYVSATHIPLPRRFKFHSIYL